MVLFTDGEDNVSENDVLAAAQNAAKAGLKIFTVGVGTAAGDLIRITDAKGNSDYVRDENGNVLKSHLNEPLLQQIAKMTGGFYLPLRGAGHHGRAVRARARTAAEIGGQIAIDPALSPAILLAARHRDPAVDDGNASGRSANGIPARPP
jgi:hypothetical protein